MNSIKSNIKNLSYEQLLIEQKKIQKKIYYLLTKIKNFDDKTDVIYKRDWTKEAALIESQTFDNLCNEHLDQLNYEKNKFGNFKQKFLGKLQPATGRDYAKWRKIALAKKEEFEKLKTDEWYKNIEKYGKPILLKRKNCEIELKKLKQILDIITKLKPKKKKQEFSAKLKSYEDKGRVGAQSIKKDLLLRVKQPWFCPYCNKKKDYTVSEADHIYPISKGGQSVIQNMVLICRSCNSKKGNKTLRNFSLNEKYDYEQICDRLINLGKDV
jgi:hypothetical protein